MSPLQLVRGLGPAVRSTSLFTSLAAAVLLLAPGCGEEALPDLSMSGDPGVAVPLLGEQMALQARRIADLRQLTPCTAVTFAGGPVISVESHDGGEFHASEQICVTAAERLGGCFQLEGNRLTLSGCPGLGGLVSGELELDQGHVRGQLVLELEQLAGRVQSDFDLALSSSGLSGSVTSIASSDLGTFRADLGFEAIRVEADGCPVSGTVDFRAAGQGISGQVVTHLGPSCGDVEARAYGAFALAANQASSGTH